jgi:molybdopterin-biosynthesis enzyme MoeA-like protein
MNFGAIIIGDEILRGKRVDRHMGALIQMLGERGKTLAWARFLGDDRAALTAVLRDTLAGDDVVFSFGGIGVTPDDHTRAAAADAIGQPLVLHPQAEIEIRARMAQTGQPVTAPRLELGHFPLGSDIIPNPVNRIPGFSWHHHHFLPGFPQMAWPMVCTVLDTHYAHLGARTDEAEAALMVWEGLEGDLLGLMQQIERDYPGLKIFSLPSLGDAQMRRHVELGVRGARAQIPAAMAHMRSTLSALGLAFSDKADCA